MKQQRTNEQKQKRFKKVKEAITIAWHCHPFSHFSKNFFDDIEFNVAWSTPVIVRTCQEVFLLILTKGVVKQKLHGFCSK